MPDFPSGVTPVQGGSVTYSFLAAGGDKASVQIPANADGDPALVRTALGNLSNAALYAMAITDRTEVPISTVNPFDESYSSASEKLILQWQDENLDLRSLAVPAPDESYFAADGVTLDLSGVAAASVSALTTFFNAGTPAGTWTFVRGYRTSRSRSQRPPRSARPSVEPGALGVPGDEPGLGT